MKSFENKVAAITGAGSGIGRALAVELGRQGCHLALADVNAAALEETRQLLASSGVRVSTAVVDVADREQVQAWADKAASEHGRVNLIFNNAGVAHAGTVEGSDYSEYEWIMNINFWGVVNGTKAFLPHLKASGNGHVVNVSSVFGLFAQPGMSAYNATKYAVRGFTESLRQELDMEDSGVSASCAHPGGIKTNIAKTARMNESMAKVTGQAADKARQQFNDQLLRTTPEKAAQVILRGVQRDSRRILIGADAHAIDVMLRLAPVLYQRVVTASMRLAARFAPRPKSPQGAREACVLTGPRGSGLAARHVILDGQSPGYGRHEPSPSSLPLPSRTARQRQHRGFRHHLPVLWQGSWLRLHRFALFPPRVAARQPLPLVHSRRQRGRALRSELFRRLSAARRRRRRGYRHRSLRAHARLHLLAAGALAGLLRRCLRLSRRRGA